MRRARHRPVVLDRAEPHRYGAAQLDQRLHQRHRLRVEASCGVTAHGPAVEERGAGGERSGPLAAGHRVAADVPLDAGQTGHLGERAGLDAAHVGHHRVGARQRVGDDRAQVVGWDRDDDELRPVAARSRAPAPSPTRCGRARPTSRSAAPRARPAAGQADGRAEQAGADHLDRAASVRHLASTALWSGRCAGPPHRAGTRG